MANFYIDYENVHNEGLKGVEKLTPEDNLYLFYSDKADTLKIDVVQKLLQTQGNLRFTKIENGVENALDFQLITALMCDYAADNNYYIISRDKGYDAAITMAQQRDRKEIFRCKDISWALKHQNNEAIDESDPDVITEITDEIEIIQTVEELLSDSDYGETRDNPPEESPAGGEAMAESLETPKKPVTRKRTPRPRVEARTEDTAEVEASLPDISPDEKDKRSYQSICTKILNTIKINHKVPLNYHQAEQVYKALQLTTTKMEFYRSLNSIMGRKEGSELYQKIKAIYKTLRGIYKASVAAAEMAEATPEAMAAAIEREPAVREINLEGIASQQSMMEIVMEALSEEALAGEDVEAEAAAIVAAVTLATNGEATEQAAAGETPKAAEVTEPDPDADNTPEPASRPRRTYRRPRVQTRTNTNSAGRQRRSPHRSGTAARRRTTAPAARNTSADE